MLAAGFEFGLGAVAWGIGYISGIDVLDSARYTIKGMVAGVMATIPLLVGLLFLLRWPVGPFADLVDKTRHFARMFLAPCGVFGLGVIAIGAGIGEEMLTRGLIHTFALQHMTPFPALILAGVIFGLMHPISSIYVVVAGVIGIYLGIVWQASGPDLVAPIVAHALYDFIALLVLCSARPPRSSNSL